MSLVRFVGGETDIPAIPVQGGGVMPEALPSGTSFTVEGPSHISL